jgi:hypothetical protein
MPFAAAGARGGLSRLPIEGLILQPARPVHRRGLSDLKRAQINRATRESVVDVQGGARIHRLRAGFRRKFSFAASGGVPGLDESGGAGARKSSKMS